MTLFVDMDEVIADTYGAHINRVNQRYGMNLTKEACRGGEVWQQLPDHRDAIWRHYFEPGFFRELDPIAGSQEVLRDLSEKYEVYIASAAMQFPNSLKEKHEWLDEYFPFIHWSKRILCGDKNILRGDILIDDRSHNLESFVGRSLIFTSPHNVNTTAFERVNSWEEVGGLLL